MPKRELKYCELCGDQYLSWRQTQRFCSKSCRSTGPNANSYKHGHASKKKHSMTYTSWSSMLNRTKGRTEHSKKYYAGVFVCKRWQSFDNFLADMGERPSVKHTLDRIEANRGYQPGNCRWATHTEQMNNVRTNRLLSFNNKTLTQEQWGREIGLSGTIINKRLKRGWSIEKALTTPRVKTGHKTKNWSSA